MVAINVILAIFSFSIGYKDLFVLNCLSGTCCFLGYKLAKGREE